ncbi:hypothetical protein H072_503 [Dactylellina haptotyla CBS 200.50]|uniref:BTB domain-containing protein n=1 Tax=Dactylellina haptotyla (strain CBS 200.50) TaxID=1284197 RepID=S8ARJ4_DACHA|nr:hypothetical protein H072_503 [Dactylellina haptotyla CBS 200.50]
MATSNGKTPQEGRTLLGYLHNSKYSDIKVLLGPDKSLFYLHRIVITTKSAYFQTICDGAFEESQTREIWLEEMEPEIFKIIVAWI